MAEVVSALTDRFTELGPFFRVSMASKRHDFTSRNGFFDEKFAPSAAMHMLCHCLLHPSQPRSDLSITGLHGLILPFHS